MTLICALQIDFYYLTDFSAVKKVSLGLRLDDLLFCSVLPKYQNICQHSLYLAAPLWCIIFTGSMIFYRKISFESTKQSG